MTPAAPPSSHAPLSCRGLSLPEQVAMWLVRRGTDGGAGATTRTATRVFGAGAVDDALRALDRLVVTLRRSPLDTPPIHPLHEADMSPEEADLLTALGGVQHGEDDATRDAIDRWGWPAAGDGSRVEQALRGLGAALLHAGQRLPRPDPRSMLTTAGVRSTGELDSREALLVDGMRRWVRWAQAGDDAGALLETCFRTRGLGAVAPALDTLLTNTVSAATRCVAVHRPGCRHLCCDEARVLHAVSSMQRRDAESCFELLADWMQPGAVRISLPVLCDLAAALSVSGHRLPLRRWRFPELSAGSGRAVTQQLPHGSYLH